MKIDRSFVSRVGLDADAAQMVRVIVALARTLSMDVVAEGVETEAQSDHLRALGCQYTQGFHFSKPIDAEAADRLIASQPWCAAANVARLVGAAECCRPA